MTNSNNCKKTAKIKPLKRLIGKQIKLPFDRRGSKIVVTAITPFEFRGNFYKRIELTQKGTGAIPDIYINKIIETSAGDLNHAPMIEAGGRYFSVIRGYLTTVREEAAVFAAITELLANLN